MQHCFRSQKTWRRRLVCVEISAAVLLFASLVSPAVGQRSPQLPGLMEKNPELATGQQVELFPEGLREVWMMALESKEADARQLAARSIVIANQTGLTEWDEVKPLLRANLSDSRVAVRAASAAALVELDDAGAAEALAKLADQDGYEVSLFVEPALADWSYTARQKNWLEWLSRPIRRQGRARLAMKSLSRAKVPEAVEPLKAIVLESRPASLRLAASTALGALADDGLESVAESLLANNAGRGPQLVQRLLAANILAAHTSTRALDLLGRLAIDEEPAVMNAALAGLVTKEPSRVIDASDEILARGDANTRRLLVDALAAVASESHLKQLADRMDDVNPTVRTLARKHLAGHLENEKWREVIRAESRRMLGSDSWRATEQATHLIRLLDDEQSTPRLLELLEFPRPETYVTAAWALQQMQPTSGIDAAFAIAEKRYVLVTNPTELDPNHVGIPDQIGHLVQWFGVARHRDAEKFMRARVPKSIEPSQVRSAGIWALGFLYEDNPDRELIKQMQARVEDVASPMPEVGPVRLACLITMGRMRDEQSVEFLKKWMDLEGVANPPGAAAAWSLNRITGAPIPKPEPVQGYRAGFFLEPLPER